jgi:hypothetical protein
MADPLQTTAESFAPSRPSTNFFDPSQSQDVLSRYAVAGRNVAEQEKTAELASRLAASRFQRAEERNRAADRELNLETQRRQNVRWGREEEDYQAKKDFEATRAGVIVGISDTLRDSVGTDQFLDKLTQLQSELAPEAREDDAIKSIVTLYSREHDFLNMERKQNEQMEKRANLSARAKAALTPEELALLPTDPYGVPDTDALLEATARKEGEMKVLKAQEKAKEEADTKAAAAAKTAETAKAVAEEKLAATGIKDLEAFPSRVKELESRKKVGAAELEAAEDPEYLQAKAFDENRLNQETLAALNYGEEEYVNILDESRKKRGLKELPETLKNARRAVWRRAKRISGPMADGPVEETAAPAPAPAPVVAPTAPAAPVAPVAPQDRLKELLK